MKTYKVLSTIVLMLLAVEVVLAILNDNTDAVFGWIFSIIAFAAQDYFFRKYMGNYKKEW